MSGIIHQGNIQQCEVVYYLPLHRVSNFDTKQKIAWNICFIIHPQHQTKSKWVNPNNTQNISVTT